MFSNVLAHFIKAAGAAASAASNDRRYPEQYDAPRPASPHVALKPLATRPSCCIAKRPGQLRPPSKP